MISRERERERDKKSGDARRRAGTEVHREDRLAGGRTTRRGCERDFARRQDIHGTSGEDGDGNSAVRG